MHSWYNTHQTPGCTGERVRVLRARLPLRSGRARSSLRRDPSARLPRRGSPAFGIPLLQLPTRLARAKLPRVRSGGHPRKLRRPKGLSRRAVCPTEAHSTAALRAWRPRLGYSARRRGRARRRNGGCGKEGSQGIVEVHIQRFRDGRRVGCRRLECRRRDGIGRRCRSGRHSGRRRRRVVTNRHNGWPCGRG